MGQHFLNMIIWLVVKTREIGGGGEIQKPVLTAPATQTAAFKWIQELTVVCYCNIF